MALTTCPYLAWKLSMSRATGIPTLCLHTLFWVDLCLYLHIAVSSMKWGRTKVSGKLCEKYWLANVPEGDKIFLLQLEKMLCGVCVCVCISM
jgi:hypothetical protein